MPSVLTDPTKLPPPMAPPRKRWTREEYKVFETAGLFQKERLELVDGELISKMGKNRPHVNAAMWMLFWLAETFGKAFVNAEAPIDVSPEDNPSNEPEPDLIVLTKEWTGFVAANPQPKDIRLLVEIADSTLPYDLSVKAALYARAGIVEYWVLDVNGRRLIVHREPEGGRYLSVSAYGECELVAPIAAPGAEFCAGRALGECR